MPFPFQGSHCCPAELSASTSRARKTPGNNVLKETERFPTITQLGGCCIEQGSLQGTLWDPSASTDPAVPGSVSRVPTAPSCWGEAAPKCTPALLPPPLSASPPPVFNYQCKKKKKKIITLQELISDSCWSLGKSPCAEVQSRNNKYLARRRRAARA